MDTSALPQTRVELFVDPACPWAWLTSRWLDAVAKCRPVSVTTRLFSLAEVNRERDEAPSPSHVTGMRALRALALARRLGGATALAATYASLGARYHDGGEPLGDARTLSAALGDAGLHPGEIESAIEDPALWEEVLVDHRDAVARGAFGVPTLSLDGGPAFFGPIIDVRLVGEEAGALWDLVGGLCRHPHLYELKRERGSIRPRIGRLETGTAAPTPAQGSAGGTQSGPGTSG